MSLNAPVSTTKDSGQWDESMTIIFILLTLFSQGWASSRPIFLVEHVVIGRNISVPGDKLCHDGVDLFFKSRQDCLDGDYDHSCRSLFIAPLRQSERIFFDRTRRVFRFFNVVTSYNSYTYVEGESGDYVNKSTQTHTIPFCAELPQKEPTIVYSERQASSNELPFLNNLFKQGITSINTGFGPLLNLRMVNQQYHQLRLISWIQRGNIKSPLCIEGEHHTNLVNKISGEYSGGGVRFLNINLLQNISGQISLPPNETADDTPPDEYHFGCIPTETI